MASQKIAIAGRVSTKEFSDGTGYYVTFGILNISEADLKINEIRGVFVGGMEEVTVKGRKLGEVSWEIQPGEKLDHYFDTGSFTSSLVEGAGSGKIILGISLYLDDKLVPGTGPFYTVLPPLDSLTNEGANLVFSVTKPSPTT